MASMVLVDMPVSMTLVVLVTLGLPLLCPRLMLGLEVWEVAPSLEQPIPLPLASLPKDSSLLVLTPTILIIAEVGKEALRPSHF